MSNGAQEYNTAAIRQLLLAAFTPEELRRFCYDRPTFRPIVNLFGPGLGAAEMVDRVVEYCDRNRLLGELLAELKQRNPGQYACFELYKQTPKPSPSSPPPPEPRSKRWWLLWVGIAAAIGVAVLVVGMVLWNPFGDGGVDQTAVPATEVAIVSEAPTSMPTTPPPTSTPTTPPPTSTPTPSPTPTLRPTASPVLTKPTTTNTVPTSSPTAVTTATSSLTATLTPSRSPSPTASLTVTATPTSRVGTPSPDVFEHGAGAETTFWESPEYSPLVTIFHPYNHGCSPSGDLGLMLAYNFEGEGESHCGWGVTWVKTPAGHFDASGFNFLAFQVRLESGVGTFDVGLKDTDNQEAKKPYAAKAADNFEPVEIPLNYYAERGVNLAKLHVVSFGFSSKYGSGTICIDDIEFK